MLENMRRGIVTHHGSLPLQARLILEHFTQKGFCRICFATSTLEQGINMPFDVVYLNTFQASKPLSMKNLIGRAGRSTLYTKFDYGSVIIKYSNMSDFRDVMMHKEVLDDVSLLDTPEDKDSDYNDFKTAINSNLFSDEYNLTLNEVEKLNSSAITELAVKTLDALFRGDKLVSLREINADLNPTKLSAVRSFYRMLLNPRKRLKTLGFKKVNNSFPFIRPHPLLRASRELAREKSREDIGF